MKTDGNTDLSKDEELSRRIRTTLKKLDTSPGQSFLGPKWDLQKDFLDIYSLLPVEIPSLKFPEHDLQGNLIKNPRKSAYLFLDLLDTKELYAKAYENVIMNFLGKGIRVKDIEADTMQIIEVFGSKDAFFEEDKLQLCDWCTSILLINFRFSERYANNPIKTTLCGGRKELHRKFDALVTLVTKLFKKIDKAAFASLQVQLQKEQQEYLEEVNRDAAAAEAKRLNDLRLKEEAKEKRRAEIRA